MSRHHVHLSPDRETATRVGARRGRPVVLRWTPARCTATGTSSMSAPTGSGSPPWCRPAISASPLEPIRPPPAEAEPAFRLKRARPERTLVFSGERVLITCVSRTSWVPGPDVEVCDADDLLAMSVRLAHDFATAVHAVAPRLAGLTPFDRWLRGEV